MFYQDKRETEMRICGQRRRSERRLEIRPAHKSNVRDQPRIKFSAGSA